MIRLPVMSRVLAVFATIFLLLSGMVSCSFPEEIVESSADPPEFLGLGLQEKVDLSPDDFRLLFSYKKDGAVSIYTSDLDGKNVKRLTTPEKNRAHIHPVFSPDGKKIAFISVNRDRTRSPLFIMNSDGTGLKQLTSDDSMVQEAVFSSDGKKIYYVQAGKFMRPFLAGPYGPIEKDIYSIHLDGSNRKQLTHMKEAFLNSLGLAGNQDKLIFVFENDSDFSSAIGILSTNGSEQITFVKPKMEIEGLQSVALSPLTRSIAFTARLKSSNEQGFELFLMEAGSSRIRRLTSLGTFAGSPRFFHHQNKLLFTENVNENKYDENDPSMAPLPPLYKLWMVDLESGKMKEIHIQIP